MSAHDAEAMVDSMLWDSPLPDSERGNEKVPEDGGSHKLPEEDDSEKLPEGRDKKLSEGLLQVNLYHFVLRKYFSLLLT